MASSPMTRGRCEQAATGDDLLVGFRLPITSTRLPLAVGKPSLDLAKLDSTCRHGRPRAGHDRLHRSAACFGTARRHGRWG